MSNWTHKEINDLVTKITNTREQSFYYLVETVIEYFDSIPADKQNAASVHLYDLAIDCRDLTTTLEHINIAQKELGVSRLNLVDENEYIEDHYTGLSFGQTLRFMRKRRGLTQSQLFENIRSHGVKGMQQITISNIENDKHLPDPFQMTYMLTELHVDEEDRKILMARWRQARKAGQDIGV